MQVAERSSGIGGGGGAAVAAMESSHEPTKTIYDRVRKLAAGSTVVVFVVSGCCMCHVVKQLLFGLGVDPTVVELDREKAGHEIHALLTTWPDT